MKAYMFPGQGSQKKGMGADLFPKYKDLIQEADSILGYSLESLCLEDKENNLGNTQFTQPALYTVNCLTYLDNIKNGTSKPEYLAGHSLGEYCALFASGVYDFITGLELVRMRGQIMSKAEGGGMAAVIGLYEESIHELIQNENLDEIDIANLNSPSQIIISGPKKAIIDAQSIFEKAGAKMFVVLKVSGAFHSRYMKDARDEFYEFIQQFDFAPPECKVISNKTARPYIEKRMKKTLADQMICKVKWCESIRYLMGKGVDKFEEVGPGNVLTGLLKNIRKDSSPLIVEDQTENFNDQEILLNDNQGASGINDKFTFKSQVNAKKESCLIDSKPGNNINFTGAHRFTIDKIGSSSFKEMYNITYSYIGGAMYHGIASADMVVRLGKSGMMGFLGTGGLNKKTIENSIEKIKRELSDNQTFGVNLLHSPQDPQKEEDTVDILLSKGVKAVEAAAFMSISPALIRYKAHGLNRYGSGIKSQNRIMAKISRPEMAEMFLSPAPAKIVKILLESGKINKEQAEMLSKVPVADAITGEADSGGHTDQGVLSVLIPTLCRMRSHFKEKYNYNTSIHIGAAGGIGTPEALASALLLGADYIVTGSINQCTIEAGAHPIVKDMLSQINIQDTDYAPAGDMFEFGAKVQVMKKGVFFPARGNKLYELYRLYPSIDQIDTNTKTQIQDKYFKKSFKDVYEDCIKYYPNSEIEKAEKNPKHKMALIFRWYFGYSTNLALNGVEEEKINFQVHCGPALGAFNVWGKSQNMKSWRDRNVDTIGMALLDGAVDLLNKSFYN